MNILVAIGVTLCVGSLAFIGYGLRQMLVLRRKIKKKEQELADATMNRDVMKTLNEVFGPGVEVRYHPGNEEGAKGGHTMFQRSKEHFKNNWGRWLARIVILSYFIALMATSDTTKPGLNVLEIIFLVFSVAFLALMILVEVNDWIKERFGKKDPYSDDPYYND